MKKFLAIMCIAMMLLTVTSCSLKDKYSMSVKPSEFSKETLKILDLFDDEIQFFDLKLDETAKSYTISVWVYRDDEWHEDATTTGGIDKLKQQIGVEITDNSYTLYMLDENGHTSYAYPTIETDFKNSMGIGSSKIDQETPIELNKELPIFVKTGTEGSSMKLTNISEDFRNSVCNAGVAVTLTVSDKAVE